MISLVSTIQKHNAIWYGHACYLPNTQKVKLNTKLFAYFKHLRNTKWRTIIYFWSKYEITWDYIKLRKKTIKAFYITEILQQDKILKKKSKKCKWNQWFVIVKCCFKLDWNCIPSYMNLRDICQWKEKLIWMWISVSERGGLFLSFSPKAQSRLATAIISHTLESPSLVLVSSGNSRCSYTCCHHRRLLLILHKLPAFLWDGWNRNANSARNHDWKALLNLLGVIYRSASLGHC